MGAIEAVAARGVIGSTGVDEVVAAVLQQADGGIGVIKASLRVGMTCTARIAGTHGVIDIPAFMHCPDSITVSDLGGREVIPAAFEGDGLRFEIDEVHRCLAEGLLESPDMSLDESVALAEALDEIREQIGLSFSD